MENRIISKGYRSVIWDDPEMGERKGTFLQTRCGEMRFTQDSLLHVKA